MRKCASALASERGRGVWVLILEYASVAARRQHVKEAAALVSLHADVPERLHTCGQNQPWWMISAAALLAICDGITFMREGRHVLLSEVPPAFSVAIFGMPPFSPCLYIVLLFVSSSG